MSNPSSSCEADGGIVEVKQSALLPFGIRRRIVLLWRQKMRVSTFIRRILVNEAINSLIVIRQSNITFIGNITNIYYC